MQGFYEEHNFITKWTCQNGVFDENDFLYAYEELLNKFIYINVCVLSLVSNDYLRAPALERLIVFSFMKNPMVHGELEFDDAETFFLCRKNCLSIFQR